MTPLRRRWSAREPQDGAWWERITIADLDESRSLIESAADLDSDEPAVIGDLRRAIALNVACSTDATVESACERLLDQMAALDELPAHERVRRWIGSGASCRSFFDALWDALGDLGHHETRALAKLRLDAVLRIGMLDADCATILAHPLRVPATARFPPNKQQKI